jgi:hypothetical protein
MKDGRVGLIDYGQSKQLEDCERLQMARLVVALGEYAFQCKARVTLIVADAFPCAKW